MPPDDYDYEIVPDPLEASVPRLRALVLRPQSGMDKLLDFIDPTHPKYDRYFSSYVFVVVATEDHRRDVGWGACILDGAGDPDLMVHVLEPHRRRGIGSRIVRILLMLRGSQLCQRDLPRVFRGTELAGLFWETFRRRGLVG